jgi:hypothetical protein
MRKFIPLFALLLALGANAQNSGTVRLYGYMRPSHPGIVPANRPNATRADYIVYLTHPKNVSFRLLSLSVGGKLYAFSTEATASPVTYINRNLPRSPRTVTLVPKTAATVEQVLLRQGPDRPGAGALKVSYLLNGKSYTKSLASWKELEPVMNE